ncbi:unnamed protein product [Polarella glacialis]|uniref:Uncharacterized protein n=1 Tax=Polarella glacialis TaxID=89957 RepID=A0A813JGT1_POLGL|nr:unnamed protein product [Polarella glacialis]
MCVFLEPVTLQTINLLRHSFPIQPSIDAVSSSPVAPMPLLALVGAAAVVPLRPPAHRNLFRSGSKAWPFLRVASPRGANTKCRSLVSPARSSAMKSVRDVCVVATN